MRCVAGAVRVVVSLCSSEPAPRKGSGHTLETLILGDKHAKKLVRFACKTLNCETLTLKTLPYPHRNGCRTPFSPSSTALWTGGHSVLLRRARCQ